MSVHPLHVVELKAAVEDTRLGTLRRMEDYGWVKREVNPNDRRSLVLSLTPAGQSQYDKILPTANALYYDIVSPLGRKELASIRGQLADLIEHSKTIID